MRVVKRKNSKENFIVGFVLCFFMWLLLFVVYFGDMKG
jgi:hypothetical protein